MLRLEPTRGKRLGFLSSGDGYKIIGDDEEIGRIDLVGEGVKEGDATIVMRERAFEGRIHITGKGRWAHIPSRWVLYSEGRELHAATWESGKTWLTVAEPGLEAMLLRRASFSPAIALERTSNNDRVAELRWRRGQIAPKPVSRCLAVESTIELPETFQLFLLWIVVMDNYRNRD